MKQKRKIPTEWENCLFAANVVFGFERIAAVAVIFPGSSQLVSLTLMLLVYAVNEQYTLYSREKAEK